MCGCLGCNAEAREAVRAQRLAEFEAFLAAKEAAKGRVMANTAGPDPSYDDAIAQMTTQDEQNLVRILTGQSAVTSPDDPNHPSFFGGPDVGFSD